MRTAARDDARAMAFLAVLYREGVVDKSGKSNEERADLSPYDREQCFIWVAAALLDGWCTRRDYGQARTHLRTAAKLGSLTAQAMLDELP